MRAVHARSFYCPVISLRIHRRAIAKSNTQLSNQRGNYVIGISLGALSGQVRRGHIHTHTIIGFDRSLRCNSIFRDGRGRTGERVAQREKTILPAITENRPRGSFSRPRRSPLPPLTLFFAAENARLGVRAINLLTRARSRDEQRPAANRQMEPL